MAAFMKELEHLKIKLEDIKSATNNFNENKVIGKGGFGKVYKGELSHYEGKSMVAIKRLDRKYGQGDPEFLKEIRMLSCYKHKNLISLLGFCKEEDEMILIYEHASHGSLIPDVYMTSLSQGEPTKTLSYVLMQLRDKLLHVLMGHSKESYTVISKVQTFYSMRV
ncbi:kinase-like domain, phloem protein 2-like protein [Tanacetum coccineum]|uniref:Kinase-like domain, phloem protein 2-like protein n=1 Tax=Tanacetum coccineum TaxID=301880 RepID=A0ABQ5B095_9ASTR